MVEADSTDVVTAEVKDMHSKSNVNEVKTKHLHLELAVDFGSKTLMGSAKHTIENMSNANKIIFDASDNFFKSIKKNLIFL